MLRVPCGLIKRDGRLLLTQRLPRKEHAGKWESPGGKAEDGETEDEALARELREELGITVRVGRLVAEVECHPPEVRKPCLVSLYETEILEGEPKPLEAADLQWFTAEELDGLDLCPANAKLLGALKDFLLPTIKLTRGKRLSLRDGEYVEHWVPLDPQPNPDGGDTELVSRTTEGRETTTIYRPIATPTKSDPLAHWVCKRINSKGFESAVFNGMSPTFKTPLALPDGTVVVIVGGAEIQYRCGIAGWRRLLVARDVP